MSSILSLLHKQFPNSDIKLNEPLSRHSTIKIGGPAEIFITSKSSQELQELLVFLYQKKIKPLIIGGGSNALFPDKGIRGIVIKNTSENSPEISSRQKSVFITVESGFSLSLLIAFLAEKSIGNLEYFWGIPGTIAGAVVGNIHGIDKRLFSDLISKIKVFDLKNGTVKFLKNHQCDFAYNQSIFKKNPNLIILQVELKLQEKSAKEINEVIEKCRETKKNQPWNSLGCVFSNLTEAEQKRADLPTPAAGWIIDNELKMKGKSVGGAQISPMHANIIVNTDNATAKDYLTLAKMVQREFKNRWNIDLKLEVKVLETS